MGLETYTGIWSFVLTNPTDGDPKYEGDNHLRGIKSAILTTWPTIGAGSTPVTASAVEMNTLVGVTSSVQTQINAKGNINAQTWTGPHTFLVAPTSPTASAPTQIPNLGQVSSLVATGPAVAVSAGARKAVRATSDGLAVEGFKAINQSDLRRSIRQARYSLSQL